MKYSTRVRNYLWNHNSPLAPSRLHQLSDALLLPASCNNMTVMSTGTRRSIENHECRKSGAKRNCIIMQKNQNIYVFCCFCVSAADFPQTQAASTVVLSHKHSRSLSALCTPVEIVWIRRSSCSDGVSRRPCWTRVFTTFLTCNSQKT